MGGKTVLAVIPARGGSVRLPRKNVLDLAGKPLIAWTIEAGLASNYIDHLIVSTDDAEIACVSKHYGADVPFMRPRHLATDEATTIDTLIHAVNSVLLDGRHYDFLVVLQPTSPLRTAAMIDSALEVMIEKKASAVISVCPVCHPVEWTNIIPQNGSLDGFLKPEYIGKRSQEFPQRYQINGAIYAVEIEKFLIERNLFLSKEVVSYEMTIEESVDIDTELDLKFARFLLSG